MKLTIATIAVVAALAGCATAPTAKSPDETAYLQEISGEAVEFDLTKEEAEDAWSRAQMFISRHASMKMQTTTDNLLETYTPEPNAMTPSYGYRVTKAVMSGKAHFLVECFNGNAYTPGTLAAMPARNAKMLARFIRTGESKYPHLVAK